jgi:hypothetical protein
MRRFVNGMIAGIAGTAALNMVTFADMAVRGRPASHTPQDTVQRLADAVRVDLGKGDRAEHRRTGLGSLLGYATGALVTAGYAMAVGRRAPWPVSAVALSTLATLAGNGPMAVLGVTDPRRWTASDWASDVVPHVAYGVVAAAALDKLR